MDGSCEAGKNIKTLLWSHFNQIIADYFNKNFIVFNKRPLKQGHRRSLYAWVLSGESQQVLMVVTPPTLPTLNCDQPATHAVIIAAEINVTEKDTWTIKV